MILSTGLQLFRYGRPRARPFLVIMYAGGRYSCERDHPTSGPRQKLQADATERRIPELQIRRCTRTYGPTQIGRWRNPIRRCRMPEAGGDDGGWAQAMSTRPIDQPVGQAHFIPDAFKFQLGPWRRAAYSLHFTGSYTALSGARCSVE